MSSGALSRLSRDGGSSRIEGITQKLSIPSDAASSMVSATSGAAPSNPTAVKTTILSGNLRARSRASIGASTTSTCAPFALIDCSESRLPWTRSRSSHVAVITSGCWLIFIKASICPAGITQMEQPGPETTSRLSGKISLILYLSRVRVWVPQITITRIGRSTSECSSSTRAVETSLVCSAFAICRVSWPAATVRYLRPAGTTYQKTEIQACSASFLIST